MDIVFSKSNYFYGPLCEQNARFYRFILPFMKTDPETYVPTNPPAIPTNPESVFTTKRMATNVLGKRIFDIQRREDYRLYNGGEENYENREVKPIQVLEHALESYYAANSSNDGKGEEPERPASTVRPEMTDNDRGVIASLKSAVVSAGTSPDEVGRLVSIAEKHSILSYLSRIY